MESYYPNYTDDEGFLFYPLEYLITMEEEFARNPLYTVTVTSETVILFAEYMNKSWWYGFKYNAEAGRYVIGIIPDKNRFKPIAGSLADFIRLYMVDAPDLYDYE
ncbi:MAG: hypothetical protein ABIR47_14700 [Candidatus Kapaibacterium sp.]